MFFGAMQGARAKLVVIKGDGMDGVSFTLAGDEHLVGRSDTPILFGDDSFISPLHANFYYNSGNLIVRDENSTNGVYIRIRSSVQIRFSDRFLVGEQVLEVRSPPKNQGPEAMADGTYFFASPPHPTHFRIVQALLGGASGMVYHARKPAVNIGREGNDINFPDDPFISGQHAQVSLEGNQLTLTDLDSKNGTFQRINGEHVLQHGDYVFMGQQLLRVEIV
ncbi:MAG: FHA domain-containing protein [Proteobacteria bacterium]|nr:FHA domain-containing protein [Pseudomonadota bacterium]